MTPNALVDMATIMAGWPSLTGQNGPKRTRPKTGVMRTSFEDRQHPEQLAKLLTVAIRQSRFVEGGMIAWHENGWLRAICQRAQSLPT